MEKAGTYASARSAPMAGGELEVESAQDDAAFESGRLHRSVHRPDRGGDLQGIEAERNDRQRLDQLFNDPAAALRGNLLLGWVGVARLAGAG